MILFYAGMGIAMMTGILGLFQVSVSLRTQQAIYKNIKIENTLKKDNDKLFLKIISDLSTINIPDRENKDICGLINSAIVNSEHPLNIYLWKYNELSEYRPSGGLDYTNLRFNKGCSLSNGEHRVIIVANEISSSYSLFSCVLRDDEKCDFEY